MNKDFLQILKERGFFYQCSDWDGLVEHFKEGPVTAYIGFDATGDSLHIGNLVQIMILRWLQKTGNKPVVLMGGATTKIGDPSDKDEARPLLSDDIIQKNADSLGSIFSQFLDFGNGPTDAKMVNNIDWIGNLNYIDMLRDIGRHFSINRMLSFESVKRRLDREQNLSFLEFNYTILQAYDFAELAKTENCTLQFGGSEQWGNIVSGIDLGRRLNGSTLFGLTVPLITSSDGKKMGKTAAGDAIWLNEDKLSSYDYYQYWRNIDDADVGRFLKLFTELPMDEIAKLEALEGSKINEAKKILAFEATALCRGIENAKLAEKTASEVFEQGGISADLPTIEVPLSDIQAGVPVIKLFKDAGLANSNGEVKRLIKGGGAKVNDTAVNDESMLIQESLINDDGVIKLSAGKKRHVLIKAKR